MLMELGKKLPPGMRTVVKKVFSRQLRRSIAISYHCDIMRQSANKLSDEGIILGDNSHVTDSLSRFSRETGRRFVFFAEKPEGHWYPGAGVGVSYR